MKALGALGLLGLLTTAVSGAIAPVHAQPAGSLTGRVELDGRGADVSEAVVYFEPLGSEGRKRAARGEDREPPSAEVVTWRKTFVPRVLPIRRGTTVRFPNRDPILHNVFSVSRGNAFDLGLAKGGTAGEVTFEEAGVVRVFCNVHHDMVAYILVLDTPWFTRPDADGRFDFRGLPTGPGRLTVWHERGEATTVPVQVPAASPVLATVEISKPRVPPHLNKWGRKYRRSRDRYR